MTKTRPTSVALLAAAALAGATSLAQDSASEVARRDLIAQAEAAAAAGDHARAVELGARAAQVRVTPSIQYFLAREHLALDHAVEALGFAGACARAAEGDPSLRNREGILRACRDLERASEARVGRLTVILPTNPPAGLSVRVRSAELPPPFFGAPYPVTPGAVRVDASAPGFQPFQREVQVAAGRTETVEVTLSPEPAVTPPPPPAPRPRPPAPPHPAAHRAAPSPSVGPWVVAGGGVAALALGGLFYGLALSARDARDDDCTPRCSPASQTYDDRYAGFLTATNVALGVGAAAVIGGATWYLVSRLRRDPTRVHALAWDLAPASGGLSLGLRARF